MVVAVSSTADRIIATAALTGWEHRNHGKLRIDFFARGQQLIAVGYDHLGRITVARRGNEHGLLQEKIARNSTGKAETVIDWFTS